MSRWELVTNYSVLRFGEKIRVDGVEAVYLGKSYGSNWFSSDPGKVSKIYGEPVERRRPLTGEELAKKLYSKSWWWNSCDQELQRTEILRASKYLEAMKEMLDE